VQQRHGMHRGWFLGCLMLCLALAACGQKSDNSTKARGDGGEVVSSREDIQSATVRIEAEGTFIDPQVGQQTVAGSGSGFIIEPSGLAVTNNHVVTGSALLRVYVGGEDEARNAKVLGVSECSDLALIDIDGGEYPFFEWHDGEANTGLETYAAGFPLGDPEFTLTRGIVSKAEADGETEWASIDSVIEHDATINNGSSGGPLVDNSGRVVGVNYRGQSDTNQYYAISREEAAKVIPLLRTGQDVNSIGVNGKAVVSKDEQISGVWVSSVESGSPAAEAGVRPGDLITRLEGLPLGTDGTMADYCDILRSRERSATMTIEVLRSETGEVLEGELNGRNLEAATAAVTEEAGGETTGASRGAATESAEGSRPEPAENSGPAPGYNLVETPDGGLSAEVPQSWGVETGENSEKEGTGPGTWSYYAGEYLFSSITTAPNLDAWYSTGTSGAYFVASRALAQYSDYELTNSLFNAGKAESCAQQGSYDDYDRKPLSGKLQTWYGCGEDAATVYALAAYPEGRECVVALSARVSDEADHGAIEHLIETVEVDCDGIA
jgi:serine protease Do